jgi:antitoxin (DNA-binding transcriptional repressor) of toxin-antitoxin stability system
MAREITQRELRNGSGDIMRALDRGETFIVTRNGVPVGELQPLRARRFVAAEAASQLSLALRRSSSSSSVTMWIQ